MPDAPLKIDVNSPNSADRPKRRSRGPGVITIGVAIAVGLAMLVTVVLLRSNRNQSANESTLASNQADAPIASETPEPLAGFAKKDSAATLGVVDDDGKTLWISPTTGPPLDMRYVPLGTKLILHIRPAALLSHPEGEKVLAALGPWGEWAIDQVEYFSGAKPQELSSLLIAIHPHKDGGLVYTLRLQLVEPWTDEQLAQRLPHSLATLYAQQPCRTVGEQVCFLPKGEAGSTLIVCAANEVEERIAQGASPPPFSRDMQRLVDHTDADRIATLLFSNKFLQASGHSLLHRTAKPMEVALQQLVGDETTAIALSTHWDENFFLELQSTITLSSQPHRFLKAVAQRLAHLPVELEDTIDNSSLHSYGQEVLNRFPAMLGQLSNHTRVGSEQGISMARCYLPSVAGHNLFTAAELMLLGFREKGQANRLDSSGPTPPQSIAELLDRPTTLSFPKETLQKALEILSEDMGVPIEIRGRDLQLEGITKNQSFAINLRDRPAVDILLAVLQLANPDRTATGPADPKQKLVYMIRKPADDQPGAIIVTTRSAAKKRGETLPDVF